MALLAVPRPASLQELYGRDIVSRSFANTEMGRPSADVDYSPRDLGRLEVSAVGAGRHGLPPRLKSRSGGGSVHGSQFGHLQPSVADAGCVLCLWAGQDEVGRRDAGPQSQMDRSGIADLAVGCLRNSDSGAGRLARDAVRAARLASATVCDPVASRIDVGSPPGGAC